MYPLDFEEFCLANGVQESTLICFETASTGTESVSDSVHDTMMRLFQAYVVVGGMPDVVQRYVDTHDIAQVIALQSDLLALYRLDIAKYADDKDRTKIRSIFDAIPSQLDDKNRRFVLADLSKNARQNRYASSFLWLADAGVALPCYNVKEPVPPLEGNGNHSLFKLFLSDTGLLCTASMGGIQYDLLQGNLDVIWAQSWRMSWPRSYVRMVSTCIFQYESSWRGRFHGTEWQNRVACRSEVRQ